MSDTKKPRGRPAKAPFLRQNLSEEQETLIFDMALKGHSDTDIMDAIVLDARSFHSLLTNDLDFKIEYMRAKDAGYDSKADSLDHIQDQHPDIHVARLVSDNIKWKLSKRKPQVYGDRLEVNMNATIDIAGSLDEARNRAKLALPIIHPPFVALNHDPITTSDSVPIAETHEADEIIVSEIDDSDIFS